MATRSSSAPRATRSSPRNWSAPRRSANRRCPATSSTCCWSASTSSTRPTRQTSAPARSPAAGSATSCSPGSSTSTPAALDPRSASRRRAQRAGAGRRRRLLLPACAARRGRLRRPAAGRAAAAPPAYVAALGSIDVASTRRRDRPPRAGRARPADSAARQHRGRRRGDVGRRPRRGGTPLRGRARAARGRRSPPQGSTRPPTSTQSASWSRRATPSPPPDIPIARSSCCATSSPTAPTHLRDLDRARLLLALATASLLTDGSTDPLEVTTQAMQLCPTATGHPAAGPAAQLARPRARRAPATTPRRRAGPTRLSPSATAAAARDRVPRPRRR